MSDENVDPNAPAPEPEDDTDDVAEIAAEVSQDANGDKRVKLGTMLKYKKESRDLGKKVKDLESRLARQQEIEDRLAEVAPRVNAILNNPRMKAEYLRMQQGAPPPAQGTEEDAEAAEYAEESGLYLPDGVTLNTGLARKQLNRIEKIAERKANERMQPFAAMSMNDKADANIARALAEVDKDGVPLATPQSINETAALLGAQGRHLLANPAVVDLILNNAIGLDRRNGRTPQPLDEPLYIASAGGRSGGAPAIDADTRAWMKKNDISEDRYQKLSKSLDQAAATRTAIVLGKD
jgi:hypothetical protein